MEYVDFTTEDNQNISSFRIKKAAAETAAYMAEGMGFEPMNPSRG